MKMFAMFLEVDVYISTKDEVVNLDIPYDESITDLNFYKFCYLLFLSNCTIPFNSIQYQISTFIYASEFLIKDLRIYIAIFSIFSTIKECCQKLKIFVLNCSQLHCNMHYISINNVEKI